MADSDQPNQRCFDVGGVLVDFERNRANTLEGEIRLEPKIALLLRVLIRNVGEVMHRDALIGEVWNGSHGADQSLSRAISHLRRLLRDSDSVRIETVPKRGYRLVGQIGSRRPTETGARTGLSSPPNAEDRAFTMSTAAPHAEHQRRRMAWLIAAFLCVGALVGLGIATSSVLTPWQLANEAPSPSGKGVEPGLFSITPTEVDTSDGVLSRSAKRLGPAMSAALADNYLLTTVAEGSSEGAEFRIKSFLSRKEDQAVSLIQVQHVPSGTNIWTQMLERPIESLDYFDEQIAVKLSQSLRCLLYHRSRMGIANDPKIMNVLAQICDASFASGKKFGRLVELSRQLIKHAPENSVSHSWLGASLAFDIYFRYDLADETLKERRDLAYHHLNRALEINPNNGQALWGLAIMNDDSVSIATRADLLADALRVEPEFPYSRNHHAHLLMSTGQVEAAAEYYATFAREFPLDRQVPVFLARLQMLLDNEAYARSIVEPLLARHTDDDARVLHWRWFHAELWYGSPERARDLASKVGVTGAYKTCVDTVLDARTAERQLSLVEIENACSNAWIDHPIVIYGYFGHTDRVFDILENQRGDFAAASNVWARMHLFEAFMAPIQRDLRFVDFANRIGLVDYWLEEDVWPDFCRSEGWPYDCREEALKAKRSTAAAKELTTKL